MKSVFSLFLLIISHFAFNQVFVHEPEITNINTTGFTLSWENSQVANSYIEYGLTKQLELGTLNAGPTQFPVFHITGAQPSQVYYVVAFAQFGGTLQQTDTLVFITRSNSTGKILTYFNKSVDHSVANHSGNLAQTLTNAIDDTLVAYINRAQESIDVAIYNTTSSSSVADIAGALNQAHLNGVNVRVIFNESTGNTGINNLLPSIPKLESPPENFSNNIGIMHNKFFVFDANATNPNLPLVWTGSTNLTVQQLLTDPNNVIIIQDQSLAKTFVIEFEEMWGGSGALPNPGQAKFGIQKKDNTPHVFNIGGKRIECYFSPSDGVNDRILKAINEAEDELVVSTMLITRNDLSSAISFRHFNGTNVAVLVNTESQSSQFTNLRNSLKGRLAEYSQQTGIMHHKTMMANVLSNQNPYVLTGSHNWSASADNINDENTLIIYDEDVTNQYFQEFMARYQPMAEQVSAEDDHYIVTTTNIELYDVSENDHFYFTIVPKIEIITPPINGIANGSNLGILSYLPSLGFEGLDSLQYRTCNETIFNYCDSAWVVFNVDIPLSTNLYHEQSVQIFPNPAENVVNVVLNGQQFNAIQVFSADGKRMPDLSGKIIVEDFTLDVSAWAKGMYLMKMISDSSSSVVRLVVQ